MTPPPTQAWAIKAPDGSLDWVGLYEPYISHSDVTNGYRCVRVEVREVE
jgi:hypothetical protein